jgi:tetratricopeptide (TPR) repeat protein
MTLGKALGDTVDMAGAVQIYRECLELALALNHRKAESLIWNNLGACLLHAAAYDDALRCFQRTLSISAHDAELQSRVFMAHGNIALACLQRGDIEQGVRAAKLGVQSVGEPTDPAGLMNRALAEVYYARLLLEVRNLHGGRSFRFEWLFTPPLWHIDAVIGWGRPSHCLRSFVRKWQRTIMSALTATAIPWASRAIKPRSRPA